MKTYQRILQEELQKEGYVNAQNLIVNAGSHCVEQVFEDTTKRYANQFKPKWISVEERLPNHFNPVIGAFVSTNYVDCCIVVKYVRQDCSVCFTDVLGESQLDITHWMPLPEAP